MAVCSSHRHSKHIINDSSMHHRLAFNSNHQSKQMLEQYEDCLISSEADNCAGERRFLWHVDGAAFDGKGRTGSASEAGAAVGTGMRSKFGNHQVNYSATKYIKP
jgi:hypothetical protein